MIERLDIELDELLGVYALDATDGDETADVDRYLQRNPRARAEVQGYREVAALLANAGSTANVEPSKLFWRRVARPCCRTTPSWN